MLAWPPAPPTRHPYRWRIQRRGPSMEHSRWVQSTLHFQRDAYHQRCQVGPITYAEIPGSGRHTERTASIIVSCRRHSARPPSELQITLSAAPLAEFISQDRHGSMTTIVPRGVPVKQQHIQDRQVGRFAYCVHFHLVGWRLTRQGANLVILCPCTPRPNINPCCP
jgi:hypothetical protein